MQAVRPLLRRSALQIAQRRTTYGTPEGYKYQSMNDLPVPKGSWAVEFQARTARYNKTLFAGIACLIIGAASIMSSSCITFHYSLPAKAGPRE